ncbi:bL21 family ribosomal protein, partial [Listeria monocytogenes]|uniref:bL21 family ribosomal protein n=1 Tax=Listeria monocytogenes TaxID=1639 RepID=UPI0013C5218B
IASGWEQIKVETGQDVKGGKQVKEEGGEITFVKELFGGGGYANIFVTFVLGAGESAKVENPVRGGEMADDKYKKKKNYQKKKG